MRMHEITGLLGGWKRGDAAALERLIPLVLGELRLLARSCLRRHRPGHTLQPTALVNELYLHLHGRRPTGLEDRHRFFAFAAATMRNLLTDHERARHAAKRGGRTETVPLDQARHRAAAPEVDLLALDRALAELAALDARQGRIVELRVFAGLSVRQTADALRVSEATVSRDWRSARAFLHRRLEAGPH